MHIKAVLNRHSNECGSLMGTAETAGLSVDHPAHSVLVFNCFILFQSQGKKKKKSRNHSSQKTKDSRQVDGR